MPICMSEREPICVRVCESIHTCARACVCERVGVCLFTFTHILSYSWLRDNQDLLSNTKKVFQTPTVRVLCTIKVGPVAWAMMPYAETDP